MYYNLTKEQYKEYAKKFNKTVIGKQYSQDKITSLIIGCILWGVAGFLVGYNSVEALTISLTEIGLFLVGGFVLVEGVLNDLEYKRELKNYILENK